VTPSSSHPADASKPSISVIILNYNGAKWMEKCLASLKPQTIFNRIEVIVADNRSSDGSDKLSEDLLRGWPNGRFLQNGANLGFCEGNNRAVPLAQGKWLFFLNNDAWLEPDCLEKLLAEVESRRASAATPLVLDYEDDTFQALGADGFDIFGMPSARPIRRPNLNTREILMAEGCSYLIDKELFEKVGRFDPEFFMFADEYDLSWRVWIAGHSVIGATSARLHHRGMAHVNPKGGGEVTEFRTSDKKRYFANRNLLMVALKDTTFLWLFLAPLQLLQAAAETFVLLLLIRRWKFVQTSFINAITDCWRLRKHIMAERHRIRQFRKRSDFQMLRFLSWRWNRLYEISRVFKFGLPKVD